MGDDDAKVPKVIREVVEDLRKGKLQIKRAPEAMVNSLRAEVDEVLAVICPVVGVGEPWVSDGSRLSDFTGVQAQVEAIGDQLGIPVKMGDYLWEIAVRLARARGTLS